MYFNCISWIANAHLKLMTIWKNILWWNTRTTIDMLTSRVSIDIKRMTSKIFLLFLRHFCESCRLFCCSLWHDIYIYINGIYVCVCVLHTLSRIFFYYFCVISVSHVAFLLFLMAWYMYIYIYICVCVCLCVTHVAYIWQVYWANTWRA